jgi:hypothetical protein
LIRFPVAMLANGGAMRAAFRVSVLIDVALDAGRIDDKAESGERLIPKRRCFLATGVAASTTRFVIFANPVPPK